MSDLLGVIKALIRESDNTRVQVLAEQEAARDKQWKSLPWTDLEEIHVANCKLFANRVDMLKCVLAKNAVVAEIGVAQGDFSQLIWDICTPKKLYLLELV